MSHSLDHQVMPRPSTLLHASCFKDLFTASGRATDASVRAAARKAAQAQARSHSGRSRSSGCESCGHGCSTSDWRGKHSRAAWEPASFRYCITRACSSDQMVDDLLLNGDMISFGGHGVVRFMSSLAAQPDQRRSFPTHLRIRTLICLMPQN